MIAVALMFLAGKLSKFEVIDWNGRNPKHNAWWDMFVEDITMELLEDICHQVCFETAVTHFTKYSILSFNYLDRLYLYGLPYKSTGCKHDW